MNQALANTAPKPPEPVYFWVLLTAVAGAVNVGAYLSCQRFVSHVTGTMTLIGADIGSWELALDYALVFACFVAGAIGSVVVIDMAAPSVRRAWTIPVSLVALIVGGVAISGHNGAFGRFGGSVESASDFALLSLLSFSMGLMNAAAARAANNARVTHLTGEATDLGVQLGMAIRRVGQARREAVLGAGARFAKLAAFAFGASLMASFAPRLGYIAFLGPGLLAATVVVAGLVFDRRAQRAAAALPVSTPSLPEVVVSGETAAASPSSFQGSSPSSQRAQGGRFSDSLRA